VSPRDLLSDPCWQGQDLGHPLPDAPHAVSVALPRWQDVIAYEEQDPICRNALQTVYPRFGLHPLLQDLAGQAAQEGWSAWPYPTHAAAAAAQTHCRRQVPSSSTALTSVSQLSCLLVDASATPHAKAFWQHTGLGASSRQAAISLGREPAASPNQGHEARCAIRERLASIHGIDAERISLHPAGMAGLYTALRALESLRPTRPTLQLGFPYVDVLKQPQVVFHGGELLQSNDPKDITESLDRLDPAAVIVELPSNPLLRCVDLPAVAELAHARGIPVIADDTIGTALNLDALPHADLIFTSLTKSFAGRGDVMAGSLLVSPHSPWADELQAAVKPLTELSDADAIALEEASRDVNQRVPQLDANGLALARRLEQHPEVAQVMHPKDCIHFKTLMRDQAGYGCLLSFELKGGEPKAQRVYNNLRVSKGPSLGTCFTLVCPYTQLAHYNELSWASTFGVPAHLLRVSVGLEEPTELWQRFEQALAG
tara:strand:+ start:1765 stop:3219 length:1455 start_codon:yes stop_codon:yes gene_type:complete